MLRVYIRSKNRFIHLDLNLGNHSHCLICVLTSIESMQLPAIHFILMACHHFRSTESHNVEARGAWGSTQAFPVTEASTTIPGLAKLLHLGAGSFMLTMCI